MHRTIQPGGWAKAQGYANGLLTDDGQLFVGGQIGWNAEQVFESHDFVGQTEQAVEAFTGLEEAYPAVAHL